jgi:hypothetical protein
VSGEGSQQLTVGAHVIDFEKLTRFWAENPLFYNRQRVGAAAPTDEPVYGCSTRATSYVHAQQLAEERARGNLPCFKYAFNFFMDKWAEQNGESFLAYYCGTPHLPLEEQTLDEYAAARPARPSLARAPPTPTHTPTITPFPI